MSRWLEYTKTSRLQRGQLAEESDGFDYPEGIRITYRLHGLCHFNCEGNYPQYPYGALVRLYAKLGLHRYNLIEGTNFQLGSLKSFNMRINCGASSYYITLAACVPDTGLRQDFHVLVEEQRLGILDLKVPIARPRVTTKCSKKEPEAVYEDEELYQDENILPNWPSEIAFSDRKRFHLVKESELRHNDWITLYLELALVSHDRTITDLYLSQLEIVLVAIETIEDVETPNETLNAKTATVYIMYKDLAKARIGEPLDRKAIVRRVINERSGELALWGDYWSGERKAWKISKKKSAMLRRRLGVHRLWRLSNPRWHQTYKNRGV